MNKLKIKLMHENALLPTRATSGSAGYDLYACTSNPVVIRKGEIVQVKTGIAIALSDNSVVGLVYARSGLAAKSGIAPVNCVGVIDSDYRGEIVIPLINHGNEDVLINNGDRIAQLVLTPIFTPELIVTEELDDTERGTGRFGSTGK